MTRYQHVIDHGPRSGRTVVLVHGLASLADEILFPLAQPLMAGGYRIVAIDRPGYGSSEAVPAAEMSPSAQARGLADTLVRLGLSDVIVVAHSIGAASALHVARTRQGLVAGLVLVNPFCRPTRPRAALGLRAATAPVIGPMVRSGLRAFAPSLGRRMVRAALHKDQAVPDQRAFPWREMARSKAVSAMADELNGFNADMIDFRFRLRTLNSPTIILADPADPVINGRAHADWLIQRMPDSTVRWRRAGHLIHHAMPLDVVDAVRSVDVATRARP